MISIKSPIVAGGLMGEQVRNHLWGETLVGEIADWPEALVNALNLMLNSPESMYLVWGDNLTFFFNDAYCSILGPRLTGALGSSLPTLWADAWPAVKPDIDLAFEGGASRYVDVQIGMARRGVPEETWWSYSYSPIYDSGNIGGVFCYTTETTERISADQSLKKTLGDRSLKLRMAEDALTQAQKMEAVGQLTGGLAHDFNNILATIRSAADLLSFAIDSQKFLAMSRPLDLIKSATSRGASLTKRLLALSRRQESSMSVVEPGEAVNSMVGLLRSSLGSKFQVEISVQSNTWQVLADPSQLDNALLNLCINARDAMDEGGVIKIATSNETVDDDRAGTLHLRAGDYVLICVEDSGCGMPPEVLDKAYEPFFTTKGVGEGTGLGLSMVYGFTVQAGGGTHLRSEVQRGTAVSMYLPRYQT